MCGSMRGRECARTEIRRKGASIRRIRERRSGPAANYLVDVEQRSDELVGIELDEYGWDELLLPVIYFIEAVNGFRDERHHNVQVGFFLLSIRSA